MSKKITNILIIFIITTIILLLSNSVFATEINMNLTTSNSGALSSSSNTVNVGDFDDNYSSSDINSTLEAIPETDTSTTIESLNSIPEANLGLTNILSIILIVIGVLLILLAIAILIRLTH